MRLLVDELPENPRDCIFSKITTNVPRAYPYEEIYICTLYPDYEGKPKNVQCICKGGHKCDLLVKSNISGV